MTDLHTIILNQVTPGERVIDVGCGDGQLLQKLRDEKNCEAYGIEKNTHHVLTAMQQGIPIFQGDGLEGIRPFEDGAFDLAILSQTLQQVMDPCQLLRELCRVANRVIVTFPNFAHWRVRWHLLVHGVSPKTRELPHDWHNTPNIRVITIKEFRRLCQRESIHIMNDIPLVSVGWRFPLILTNFFTKKGIFILCRS